MQARRLMRRAAALAGALSLVIGLSACSVDTHVDIDLPPQVDAELSADARAQLEDAVTHAMAASGSSGAIVGVWVPWAGTWVAGLGTQSPSSATPVTPDMVFRAGPLTRPMICDVLFALDERGTVSVGDVVTEYVSGVPDLADVTLGQLCASTSGIGSYAPQLQSMWLQNPERRWNPRELASYGVGRTDDVEPGAAFRSSDAGYVLLGLALERATGSSAASLLEQYVFEPLDMTSTRLPGSVAAEPGGDAPSLHGHFSLRIPEGRNCAEPLDITRISASIGFTDSGVVSTVPDLGRYAQALATGALLAEDADRFPDPIAPYGDAPAWHRVTAGAVHAGALVGQYGAFPGYLTAAYADPDTGLTVALVLNNSAARPGMATFLAWELAAIASKLPAAAGETAPQTGLPWTAEHYHQAIADAAICPIPSE